MKIMVVVKNTWTRGLENCSKKQFGEEIKLDRTTYTLNLIFESAKIFKRFNLTKNICLKLYFLNFFIALNPFNNMRNCV